MKRSTPVKVIAVTSGKGGAGKTSVAVNLGAALARRHERVLLLDADLGLANIDVLLGLQPRYTLAHVLRGERALREVIVSAPGGLRVVPAASGVQRMAELNRSEHAGLIAAFSEMYDEIDTLIIDTAAGISDSVTSFCQAASEVLVVLCDEPASLADGYGLIKVLNRDHGVTRFQVLANMVDTPCDGFELYQRLLATTDRFLNVAIEYAGHIPRDPYLPRANRQRRLLLEAWPQSRAAQAFLQLAERVREWTRPPSPSGRLEFFVDRLVASEFPA